MHFFNRKTRRRTSLDASDPHHRNFFLTWACSRWPRQRALCHCTLTHPPIRRVKSLQNIHTGRTFAPQPSALSHMATYTVSVTGLNVNLSGGSFTGTNLVYLLHLFYCPSKLVHDDVPQWYLLGSRGASKVLRHQRGISTWKGSTTGNGPRMSFYTNTVANHTPAQIPDELADVDNKRRSAV